jgi:hypothetical protein
MSSVLQSIGDPLSEKETEVCQIVYNNHIVKQTHYIFNFFFSLTSGFSFGSGLSP